MDEVIPEPIAVLSLDYAMPIPAGRRRWRRIVWALLPGIWLECLIALICILMISVESVVVSGPVIFASGALLLIGSFLIRARVCMIVAAGHCAICLLFFGLVNLLRWSPEVATRPFIVMGTIYVTVSLPVSFAGWRRLR